MKSSLVGPGLLLLGIGSFTLSCFSAQPPRYEVIDVGVDVIHLDHGANSANVINNRGQIFGTYFGDDGHVHTFLYENGHAHNISPDGMDAWVFEANDLGQFIGDFPGGFTGNPPLQTPPGFLMAAPVGLNNHGVVVGVARREDAGPYLPFVYSNGVFTVLPVLAEGQYAGAVRVNNHGVIIGTANVPNGFFYAVIYEGTNVTSLGTLPGHEISSANSMNDLGHVTGVSGNLASAGEISLLRGFLYRDGCLLDLGALPRLPGTIPSAMNNHDQVVGTSENQPTPEGEYRSTAFLWNNGRMHDLNDLLIPHRNGVRVVYANDINDAGWIVGLGQGKNFSGPLLLRPVDSKGSGSQH